MYASCDNLQIPTFDDFLYEETEQFIVRLQFTGIYSTSAAYDIPLSLFDNDAPPDWTTQVDYYYDDQNRLISRREEHSTQPALNSDTAFYYDGSQVALQARDGHLANRLTWGPTVDHLMAEEQLDWTNPSSPEADVLWTLGDHLNSNRDIVVYDAATETASIANHIIYDSFGNLESQTSFVITTDYRWTGRWFDVTVGLQNNVNRWYDPMIGQWVNEDPWNFDGGDSSLRRYVANSPLLLIDPAGTEGIVSAVIGWIIPNNGTDPYGIGQAVNQRPADETPLPTPPPLSHPTFVQGMPNDRYPFDHVPYFLDFAEIVLGIPKSGHQQISRGCVGLAMYRLGWFIDNKLDEKGPPPKFPHQVPGSKWFIKLEDAIRFRDKMQKQGKQYNVVAEQVEKYGGFFAVRDPALDAARTEPGEIFQSELKTKRPSNRDDGITNFATLVIDGQGQWRWEYMTHHFDCPSAGNPDGDIGFGGDLTYVLTPTLPEAYHEPFYVVAPVSLVPQKPSWPKEPQNPSSPRK
jgi:RHS repeat-associated protein